MSDMKRYLLLIFCMPMSLLGQNQYTSSADSDPEAIEILSKLAQRINEADDLSLDIDIHFDAPGQDRISQKASVQEKGSLMRSDAMGVETYSNEKGKWVYNADANEVEISDPEDGSDFLSTPSQLVSLENYPDFVFAIEDIISQKDGAVYQLVGKPTGDAMETLSFVKLEIFEKGDIVELKSVRTLDKSGTNIFIEISLMKLNLGLEDDYFYFDPTAFPDVHIEDLRF